MKCHFLLLASCFLVSFTSKICFFKLGSYSGPQLPCQMPFLSRSTQLWPLQTWSNSWILQTCIDCMGCSSYGLQWRLAFLCSLPNVDLSFWAWGLSAKGFTVSHFSCFICKPAFHLGFLQKILSDILFKKFAHPNLQNVHSFQQI